MNKHELNQFITYYKEIERKLSYAHSSGDYSFLSEKEKKLLFKPILPVLYLENDPQLLSLLKQQCDHEELFCFLKKNVEKDNNSESVLFLRERGYYHEPPEVTEPLAEWIYNYNYMLAYPLLGDMEKDITLLQTDPELILSFVYIGFMVKKSEETIDYSYHQSTIEALYEGEFDAASTFCKWGLIPIDEKRILFSFDEPVRVYDKEKDKTIFLIIKRSLAMVFDELIKKQYIAKISFRGDGSCIYEGENHFNSLCEEVEKGLIFSLNLSKLPSVTKLYRPQCYDDCLWIKTDNENITFEELCSDFHIDEDTVVTQMLHLEYRDNLITHMDHELIFYSLEEYADRVKNCLVKGTAHRRIKSFKIDSSAIPVDYPCRAYKIKNNETKEVIVPFLYFVLNSYFEHKDLLKEYFSNVINGDEVIQ